MAVSHSAASESHTGTTGSTNQASFSWTHAQTGTPQGVLVFVHTINASNFISSVTYGGVALDRIAGAVAIDTAGEPGRTDLFFLGTGLGTGNQTITVNRTNNATIMYASAATVLAATDTFVTGILVEEQNQSLTEENIDDGSVSGTNSLRYCATYTGLAAPPAAGTGSTLLTSIDLGSYGAAMVRETTAGQGSRPVGFSSGSDDVAAVYTAVREAAAYILTADVSNFTLVGIDADLIYTAVTSVTAEAGAFTATGINASLLYSASLIADVAAFTLIGNDALLTKTANQNTELITEAGTFTETGIAATLSHAALIAAAKGTFTETGIDAGLRYNARLTADAVKFFLPERNMRLWSESFDNAAWTKNNSSITANATTAPDGTLTADALIENTTPNISHRVTQNITYATGRTYTASCYFKLYPGPITRYARLQLGGATVFGTDTYININLATGTIIATVGSPSASGITNEGNGWYLAWLTKQYTGTGVTTGLAIQTISTTGTSLYTDADGLSGIYIWGAQFEEGSLSDYDPTGPVTATRTDVRATRILVADKGAFTESGVPATLIAERRLVAATRAFNIAGNDANILYLNPATSDKKFYYQINEADPRKMIATTQPSNGQLVYYVNQYLRIL